MSRKPDPMPPKNEAIRVRLDAKTLARVHANAGFRGTSGFIRQAVEDALARFDKDLSQPTSTAESESAGALEVELGPVLLAIRDAADVVISAHKDGAVTSGHRLASIYEKLERLEHKMLVIAHVSGLIAKQVDIKITVPAMPPPYASLAKTAPTAPPARSAPRSAPTTQLPQAAQKPVRNAYTKPVVIPGPSFAGPSVSS